MEQIQSALYLLESTQTKAKSHLQNILNSILLLNQNVQNTQHIQQVTIDYDDLIKIFTQLEEIVNILSILISAQIESLQNNPSLSFEDKSKIILLSQLQSDITQDISFKESICKNLSKSILKQDPFMTHYLIDLWLYNPILNYSYYESNISNN